MRKVLVSIVTTKNSDWQAKIKETKELRLSEVAVFLTCLDKKARQRLYKLLESSSVKSVPLVHLRGDMEPGELDYFLKNYKTKFFVHHSQSEYPFLHDYSKYKDIIFIENVYKPLDEEELKNFGGICLDLSHLENDRILEKEKFGHNIKIIEKYPIGCNHISVMKKISHKDENIGTTRYDRHFLDDLSELDYLKNYWIIQRKFTRDFPTGPN